MSPRRAYRALKPLVNLKAGERFRPGDTVLLDERTARLLEGRVELLDVALDDAAVERVRGIGPERARGLACLGIETLTQLVAADPVEIEQRMPMITVEQARGWIKAARELLLDTDEETKTNANG
jgi:hypothetical protein